MFNVFAIAAAVLALAAPLGGPPPATEYKYTATHREFGGDLFGAGNALAATPVGRIALSGIGGKAARSSGCCT